MQIRSLIIFFALMAAGVKLSRAAEFPLQDSVKRVYITVTAEQKPKTVTMESYTADHAVKKASVKRKVGRTRIEPSKLSETSDRIFPSPSKKPTIAGSKENSVATQQKNSRVNSSVPSQPHNTKPTVEPNDIHQEISQAQTLNDAGATSIPQNTIKASKTYLWVGIVLVVVGIILGILFGKTALLVSIAGMIFVIIGYTIKS